MNFISPVTRVYCKYEGWFSFEHSSLCEEIGHYDTKGMFLFGFPEKLPYHS